MSSHATMPAAFIGHGSPMNALMRNRYTDSWRALGGALPTPRAILVVSAHWYINATAVTAMPRPRTIHDFFGFPQELFALQYPAPGAPAVADEVAEIAKPTWVGHDVDSWGIDHGTWSVLAHMFPEADVPVVQLSINAMKPFDYHLELGAKLAPLRESGVLVVGSGNVVHNLAGMEPRLAEAGFDWAQRFDEAARETMTGSPGALPSIQGARDFAAAVPTPDHFIPLLYLAGLAGAADRPADVLVDGYAYGSLSMTAYTLDLPAPPVAGEEQPDEVTSGLSDGVPPDATNM
ncbi:MAG TPA: 4,5-DOPA dioxygenase extradiol [Pseudonocardia sp.]|nr:4,5-DOPA dioxygenase extradiol [Pseudonocardia sp.]